MELVTTQQDSKVTGFTTRSLIIALLPYTKITKKIITIENADVRATLSVSDSKMSLPYGAYPRVMLMWLVTEAIKTKSREINLGNSISRLMETLEINVTGGRNGTINRFKEQLKSLLNLQINITGENKRQWVTTNYSVAEQASLYLINKDNEDVLFESKILLSQPFFDEIISNPVMIDFNVIKELRSSSLALDIYCWLAYKTYVNKEMSYISYDNLFNQFGYNYENSPKGKYEFKRKFIYQLEAVLTHIGKHQVSYTKENLIIKPKFNIKKINEFSNIDNEQQETTLNLPDDVELFLKDIAKKHSMNIKQLQKAAHGKNLEQLKSILSYVENKLNSGLITSPKGFLYSAIEKGFVSLESEQESKIRSIAEERAFTQLKKEQEVLSKIQIYNNSDQAIKDTYNDKLNELKEYVGNKYGQPALENWFKDLNVLYVNNDEICLHSKNSFVKDWLEKN